MRPTAFLSSFLLSASFLSAADPALLNMIMPDAKVLAGFNIAKAEASPFGQFLLHSVPNNQGFEQFTATSGFDPRTDLQEILAANNGVHKTGIILARGRFNAALISSAAVMTGAFTTSVYSGSQLITPIKAGAEAMAIVLDSTPATLAVVGDITSVKAALDRRTASNPLNAALAAKVAEYSAADVWSVSTLPLSSLSAAGAPNPLGGALQGDVLKKIQETSGGITFSSPIQITGEAVANTPQDASALGDVIRFLVSMVQSSSGPAGNPLSGILQALNVTTSQNTVKIALSIGESDLELLLQSHHAAGAGVI